MISTFASALTDDSEGCRQVTQIKDKHSMSIQQRAASLQQIGTTGSASAALHAELSTLVQTPLAEALAARTRYKDLRRKLSLLSRKAQDCTRGGKELAAAEVPSFHEWTMWLTALSFTLNV